MKSTTKLTAKNINDSFWIVQSGGRKIGNITVDSTGVDFQQGNQIRHFGSLQELSDRYPITWQRYPVSNQKPDNDVFGYPTKSEPFNPEFDIHRRLPLYTEESDSKSKRCAGHYLVNLHKKGWSRMFCPKLITLDRYSYYGPYMDRQSMLDREADINAGRV
jgi:hypothetical protein